MHTIAIVGQGAMARAHARAWSELGIGDRIRYVCAPRPAGPLEHAPRARFVTDLSAVLSDPEVDVVSVCTPTPTHAQIAIETLAAGKNTLLEKPIALTLTDALAIRSAAARSTGILMVAHGVRFFGGYSALRTTVESGALGRIYTANARRISTAPGPSPWWHDESKSGGVLVDFAIHDFDQLNLFLGEPSTVSARLVSTDGPYEATVEYNNGSVGRALSFMGMPNGVPFESAIDLLGSDGSASHVFTGALDSVGDRSGADSIRLLSSSGERRELVSSGNPYAAQAAHFLRCIEAGTPSSIAPTDAAVLALAVALASRASLVSGHTERVERDWDRHNG